MTREEADRALARFAEEHEAVESSLLALQDHSGRRLLEGAELTGVTARRWAETEALITRLWAHFDASTAALERARALRGRRRWPTQGELNALAELLLGDGVHVPGQAPGEALSGDQPALLTERLSLTALLDRMNAWYGRAVEVVAAADSVWSALPARVDLLNAEARRVRDLAHSIGVRPGTHPAGDALAELLTGLTALRAEAVSDPLAFWTDGAVDTSRYDAAGRRLEDIRREVEAVLHVRDDADHRLRRVADVVGRADRTLTEARSARGEVLAKIAASEVPAVSGPAAALHERLALAVELLRGAQWHRLSPLLDSLEREADEELDRARDSLTAVTAPLAVRAELRGRLDAYRAKSARHRVAEDPVLTERYDQARRLLWSAPCDLRAADHAVLRYQRAVAEAIATASEAGLSGPDSGPVWPTGGAR
jgi:hypothetical protein